MNPLDRINQVDLMANCGGAGFPAGTEADVFGISDPSKATPAESAARDLLRQWPMQRRHAAPYYTDNLMHDLGRALLQTGHNQRHAGHATALVSAARHQDLPPYLHDGALLTPDDTSNSSISC
jgi:hypothetical protein